MLTVHRISKSHYALVGKSGSGKSTIFGEDIQATQKIAFACKVYIVDPKATMLHQLQNATYYTTDVVKGLNKLKELLEQRTPPYAPIDDNNPPLFFYIDEVAQVLSRHKEAKSLLKRAFQQPFDAGLFMRVSAQKERELRFLGEESPC